MSSAYPPGPKGWLRNLRSLQHDALQFLTNLSRTYGDAAHFKIGPQPYFFFTHPDQVKEVLVTHQASFRKNRLLQRGKIVFGEGLLTSENPLHIRQRRLAQPAFHRERIARYGEVMVEKAKEIRDRWHDGEVLDMAREMSAVTLSVVAQTLLSTEVAHEADEVGEVMTDLMEMFPILVSPLAPIILKMGFLPRIRRFRRSAARLDRTIYSIIDGHRRSGIDRGDLLSMLILATDVEGDGSGMTDTQLRDETITMFAAGHETTAMALTWTWYLLARNPEVEREFHREVEAVLCGRAPTPADYPRLKYTEMVFAEALRLYPPGWITGREAIEPVRIGGYDLPKGAAVMTAQGVTHRDPRFWPDPDRFDPLRFTPEAKAARPKMAYFPFGAGSRICVGEAFAWMEGVLVLATLGQRWKLESLNEVEIKPVVTLRPRTPMQMRATRRPGAGSGKRDQELPIPAAVSSA
jgi:cytochrome P450